MHLVKIYPGELSKGMSLLKQGKKIDYVGASAVEPIGGGELSIGSFREILIKVVKLPLQDIDKTFEDSEYSGSSSTHAMLSISNISKSFGGIKALNNVSLNFEKGHITALIGPNGLVKTNAFNVINGSLKPDAGKVCLNTENITGLEPHQLFSKGVLRDISNFTRVSIINCFR